jgi:outer membrane protein OmpA-like peptidoglycan-associated protein
VRVLALLIALSACGQQAAPDVEATPQAAPVPAPSPPSATSGRQIGSVSGLSAETSSLTADISGFSVERTDTGTRVLLAADTLFDFDKATLTAAAEQNLRRAADLVRQGGEGAVTVTGFTDAKGEDAYNLALSRRRAEAVAGWFRTQPELRARTFKTEGRGEADPVAPNTTAEGTDDPTGRARNRRVTIDIPRGATRP